MAKEIHAEATVRMKVGKKDLSLKFSGEVEVKMTNDVGRLKLTLDLLQSCSPDRRVVVLVGGRPARTKLVAYLGKSGVET